MLIHQACSQFERLSLPWRRKGASNPIDGHIFASKLKVTTPARPLLAQDPGVVALAVAGRDVEAAQ